ncbi:MAG: hypothetical protein FWF59_05300 [Turicibacter sp.]|nr:hypothetical protein [Turicibacter sp.]
MTSNELLRAEQATATPYGSKEMQIVTCLSSVLEIPWELPGEFYFGVQILAMLLREFFLFSLTTSVSLETGFLCTLIF